jgi:hypothetical protein
MYKTITVFCIGQYEFLWTLEININLSLKASVNIVFKVHKNSILQCIIFTFKSMICTIIDLSNYLQIFCVIAVLFIHNKQLIATHVVGHNLGQTFLSKQLSV